MSGQISAVDKNTLNLDQDPEFRPNLDPDPGKVFLLKKYLYFILYLHVWIRNHTDPNTDPNPQHWSYPGSTTTLNIEGELLVLEISGSHCFPCMTGRYPFAMETGLRCLTSCSCSSSSLTPCTTRGPTITTITPLYHTFMRAWAEITIF